MAVNTRKIATRRAKVSLPLALIALALAGCAGAGRPGIAAPPASGPDAPAASPDRPSVLLLGEVHDNPQGIRERTDDLRRRIEAGWRPAIAMEQFDRERQALLSAAQHDCRAAACVIQVMEMRGWNAAQYRPVIDLALTYQLPLIAANFSRADAARVVRDGLGSAFDPATAAAFHLDRVPAALRAGQREAMVAGHCHMLPDTMVDGMADAQIARDVWMAKLILAQAPRDVVLLAGNGHLRKDIGVPRWLAVAAPGLAVRSVAYLEAGADAPAGQYDAARTVAPAARADPCAGLKPGA